MEPVFIMILPLVAGYILDLIFGDPRSLPPSGGVVRERDSLDRTEVE